MPLATYKDLCIDANDAEQSARFWAGLLGLTPGKHHNGAWFLDDEDGRAVAWVNPVPEPKTVKNRMHIDVNAEGLEAALAAGASVARRHATAGPSCATPTARSSASSSARPPSSDGSTS